MRNYGTIHTRFWELPEIAELSLTSRLLAVYLLTSPHSNLLGCYRLSTGYVMDDLRLPVDDAEEAFAELESIDFLHRCKRNGWVLLPKYLKFNPIENKNQAIAAKRLIDKVPPTATFIPALRESIQSYGGDHANVMLASPVFTQSGVVGKSGSAGRLDGVVGKSGSVDHEQGLCHPTSSRDDQGMEPDSLDCGDRIAVEGSLDGSENGSTDPCPNPLGNPSPNPSGNPLGKGWGIQEQTEQDQEQEQNVLCVLPRTDANAPPTPEAKAEEHRKATRRGELAKLLRDAGVKITSGDPLVNAWEIQGLTDAEATEALERARLNKPAPEPIPAKYLRPIVEKVLGERDGGNEKPPAAGRLTPGASTKKRGDDYAASEQFDKQFGKRFASTAG